MEGRATTEEQATDKGGQPQVFTAEEYARICAEEADKYRHLGKVHFYKHPASSLPTAEYDEATNTFRMLPVRKAKEVPSKPGMFVSTIYRTLTDIRCTDPIIITPVPVSPRSFWASHDADRREFLDEKDSKH